MKKFFLAILLLSLQGFSQTAYVTSPKDATVLVFDFASKTMSVNTIQIKIGTINNDHGGVAVLSPNNKLGYVTDVISNLVSVIHLKEDPHIITTIAVGADLFGIAYSSAYSQIWVGNKASTTLSIIDPRSNQVIHTIDVKV